MRFFIKAINMGILRPYLLFILMVAISLGSCSLKRDVVIDQQEQDKRLEQRYQESEKIIDDARKRHYNMQNRETKQRMRETKRQSNEWNRGRPPFYIRWYRSVVSWFR